jgi:flagellar transcriptional activator FlhD
MLDDEVLNAIQEQNLSYLLLAQKLLADDRKTAMFRLHYDESMADLIGGMTIGQLLTISSSSQLLCGLSLNDADKLKTILFNERSSSLVKLHMAMMLTSDSNQHKQRGATD